MNYFLYVKKQKFAIINISYFCEFKMDAIFGRLKFENDRCHVF
jgi:hypothetical protein